VPADGTCCSAPAHWGIGVWERTKGIIYHEKGSEAQAHIDYLARLEVRRIRKVGVCQWVHPPTEHTETSSEPPKPGRAVRLEMPVRANRIHLRAKLSYTPETPRLEDLLQLDNPRALIRLLYS